MNEVFNFLSVNNIEFTCHEHPAVYTVEEAEKYRGNIKGMASKNLFLRNQNKKRYFLVVLPAKKQTDLKKFALLAGEKKVSFASSEALKEMLRLEPGSVSPFGLINDVDCAVEFFMDKEVYNADTIAFHPNVNTCTLELTNEMFRKFLKVLRRDVYVIDLLLNAKFMVKNG